MSDETKNPATNAIESSTLAKHRDLIRAGFELRRMNEPTKRGDIEDLDYLRFMVADDLTQKWRATLDDAANALREFYMRHPDYGNGTKIWMNREREHERLLSNEKDDQQERS